jgi:hypothetical protein
MRELFLSAVALTAMTIPAVAQTTADLAGCDSFAFAVAAATRMKAEGEADTTIYIGKPGAAVVGVLDNSFGTHHPEAEPGKDGFGAFVVIPRGTDDAIVGIVDPKREMVCESRRLTISQWEAVKTLALGPTL